MSWLPKSINFATFNRFSLLSALSKNTEIIDLLLGRGGKSAAADSMHVAALTGNIEAVKQHLAAGTDVNAKDGIQTPLHYAASIGQKEITNY